jgi:formate/nitrite transporter FocA (FNT family)
VSGRDPAEIWEEGLDEGERRLTRGWIGLAATGMAGGIDVFFSVLVLAVTSAALHEALPESTAHVLASLTFGVGFAFITLGRAELFTENFLVAVGTVWAGRVKLPALLRMWALTLVFNFAGLALLPGSSRSRASWSPGRSRPPGPWRTPLASAPSWPHCSAPSRPARS